MTNVHQAYRTTLSYWKRRLFDPFRRRQRIHVRIGGEVYETTLGQANFALWSYETGVYAYVLHHIEHIEASMNRVSQTQKRERQQAKANGGGKRRRKELTPSPPAVCVAYMSPTSVSFRPAVEREWSKFLSGVVGNPPLLDGLNPRSARPPKNPSRPVSCRSTDKMMTVADQTIQPDIAPRKSETFLAPSMCKMSIVRRRRRPRSARAPSASTSTTSSTCSRTRRAPTRHD